MTPCPPPSSFKPAEGVIWASWSSPPPFLKVRRRAGRRAQGVRYERKVHEYFTSLFPDTYVANPWLKYQCGDGAVRWCQPDGLIIDVQRGEVVIVEVKYQHTSDAWWQLEKLYRPVLEVLLPKKLWKFRCVEVVKWFDPVTAFPAPIRMSEVPCGVGDLSVHIWRP